MNHWLTTTSPLVIAHRGASADAPENTLSAFALAAAQGADAVELDVRLSADGWPIIVHDDTVDRTTNGRGRVAELTVAELQNLDAGNGQSIPTLDQLFETFGPAMLYNIELKSRFWPSQGLAAAVADRIESHQLEERVLVSSFNLFLLRQIRRHLPRRTPLALLHSTSWMRYAHSLVDCAAVHPEVELVDADYISWARSLGYRIHVWTVDQPELAKRLVSLGVHGLVTNNPAIIVNSLS